MKTCVFCQWQLAYDFTRQRWHVTDSLVANSYECTYNETMTKTHRPLGGRNDEAR